MQRVRDKDRPDEAFTTDRAVRAGRANASSGRIMVTVPNDHFGPIPAEHDPRGLVCLCHLQVSAALLKPGANQHGDVVPCQAVQQELSPIVAAPQGASPLVAGYMACNRAAVQGIRVGEFWNDRLDCRQWGAHFPHVAGIAGQSNQGAQSVVLSGGCVGHLLRAVWLHVCCGPHNRHAFVCAAAGSVARAEPVLRLSCEPVGRYGRYEDDRDEGEWFLYTGSGGRDLSGNKRVTTVRPMLCTCWCLAPCTSSSSCCAQVHAGCAPHPLTSWLLVGAGAVL